MWHRGHQRRPDRPAGHRVRDVTVDEDRSHVRTGVGLHIMAGLRTIALSLFRLAGWDDIAAALRHHSRHPDETITYALAVRHSAARAHSRRGASAPA